VNRPILFAVLALLAGALPVCAQAPASGAPGSDSGSASPVHFLSHSAFHLAAEHLSTDDIRFKWDTNFGGDVDLVDYGRGRLNFLANYQAILGHELRAFDPEQGNYVLEGAVSLRTSGVEASAVFYHQSRHLSDRPKRFAIDWNSFGGRVEKALSHRAYSMDARVDLRGVIYKSYVDYNWELDSNVRNAYRVRPTVSVISDAGLRLVGVNGSRSRGTQTGAHGEGGVRIEGSGAAVELYASIERRIDPYPTEFTTASWVGVGFRLVSR
jgi:hypothetical protein